MKFLNQLLAALCVMVALSLTGCKRESSDGVGENANNRSRQSTPVPRRYAYPRINLPVDARETRVTVGNVAFLTKARCDSSDFANQAQLSYPELNATLYISANAFHGRGKSEELNAALLNRLERIGLNLGGRDATQTSFVNANGFNCNVFTANGIPTPVQFFATTSGDEESPVLVSGAVYLAGNTTNADSIAPVVAFLESDILNMMQHLEFSDTE